MEGKSFHLRLVSPTETVFEGEAASVSLPAWDGKMGILAGHAHFIGLLGGGTMEIELPDGKRRDFFVVRGVVKVEGDRVTVLSEYAGSGPPEGYDPRSAWLDPEEVGGAPAGEATRSS